MTRGWGDKGKERADQFSVSPCPHLTVSSSSVPCTLFPVTCPLVTCPALVADLSNEPVPYSL